MANFQRIIDFSLKSPQEAFGLTLFMNFRG